MKKTTKDALMALADRFLYIVNDFGFMFCGLFFLFLLVFAVPDGKEVGIERIACFTGLILYFGISTIIYKLNKIINK